VDPEERAHLFSAEHWSVLLDLKILLKTVGCVVGGEVAF
jgi:lipopolysaccharide/colanic/teichoic acid biosynthesis glycosyltransferase